MDAAPETGAHRGMLSREVSGCDLDHTSHSRSACTSVLRAGRTALDQWCSPPTTFIPRRVTRGVYQFGVSGNLATQHRRSIPPIGGFSRTRLKNGGVQSQQFCGLRDSPTLITRPRGCPLSEEQQPLMLRRGNLGFTRPRPTPVISGSGLLLCKLTVAPYFAGRDFLF